MFDCSKRLMSVSLIYWFFHWFQRISLAPLTIPLPLFFVFLPSCSHHKTPSFISGRVENDKSSLIFFLPYHRAKLKSTFGCTDNDLKGHLHSSNLLKVRPFRDFALRLLQAEVIVTHCFLKGIHQSHLLWHWLPWLIKKASEDQHLFCHPPPQPFHTCTNGGTHLPLSS